MDLKLAIVGIAAVSVAAAFMIFFLSESGEIVKDIEFVNEREAPFQEINLIGEARQTEPQKLVIKTQEDFLKLWEGTKSKEKPGTSNPKVDFASESVVALFMGEQSTGGYSIGVVRIVEQATRVIIYYRETSPGPGDIVTQAFTYPQHVVKTEKITKPVVFQKLE